MIVFLPYVLLLNVLYSFHVTPFDLVFMMQTAPVPPVKAIGVPYIMLRYVFLFEMLRCLILSRSFYAASPRSIRPVVWRFPYPYFLPSLIKFSACCLILSSTRYAA